MRKLFFFFFELVREQEGTETNSTRYSGQTERIEDKTKTGGILPIPCRGGIRLLPQLGEGIGCGGDGEVDGGGGR